MVAGQLYSTPSARRLHRAAENLSRPCLRQRLDDHRRPEAREGADRRPDAVHQLVRRRVSDAVITPAFSTTRPTGTSPFSSSAAPITAHSATSGWLGKHFFDSAGRQPVPGHVDDVVDAAHHVEVAVLVHVAGVAREVVARVLRQVRPHEPVVVVPERRQAAGRQRQRDDDLADLAGAISVPSSAITRMSNPGTGHVGEPGLIG